VGLCTVLCCIVQYRIVEYCEYSTVRFCDVLYCVVHVIQFGASTQCSRVQYCALHYIQRWGRTPHVTLQPLSTADWADPASTVLRGCRGLGSTGCPPPHGDPYSSAPSPCTASETNSFVLFELRNRVFHITMQSIIDINCIQIRIDIGLD